VEQPIGVGFSDVGGRRRPASSAEAAVDVVAALDGFFRAHPDLAARPLILAGESYGGRYVPEIAALATSLANGGPRSDPVLPAGPPSFSFRGVAIGNGLVDPESQAATIGPYLAERGLLNETSLAVAEAYTRDLTAAVKRRDWGKAHEYREAAVAFLETTALGPNRTLLDVRRASGYDANNTVRRLLRRADARAALNVTARSPKWVRKAPDVARALHDDKAVSSAPLVQGLLEGGMPVLLYYGVEDAKDGAYSSAPWISRLAWPGRSAYNAANVEPLPKQPDGDPGGAFKSGGGLTVAEVYDAGHMAPRDSGGPVREFVYAWIDDTVVGGAGAVDIDGPAPAAAP
jgi:carboxypeptidase C (cathepsin A)